MSRMSDWHFILYAKHGNMRSVDNNSLTEKNKGVTIMSIKGKNIKNT